MNEHSRVSWITGVGLGLSLIWSGVHAFEVYPVDSGTFKAVNLVFLTIAAYPLIARIFKRIFGSRPTKPATAELVSTQPKVYFSNDPIPLPLATFKLDEDETPDFFADPAEPAWSSEPVAPLSLSDVLESREMPAVQRSTSMPADSPRTSTQAGPFDTQQLVALSWDTAENFSTPGPNETGEFEREVSLLTGDFQRQELESAYDTQDIAQQVVEGLCDPLSFEFDPEMDDIAGIDPFDFLPDNVASDLSPDVSLESLDISQRLEVLEKAIQKDEARHRDTLNAMKAIRRREP